MSQGTANAPHDPATERAILVDDEDRVIGTAPRWLVRRDKLLHRGVAVLCRDPAGWLYVHRRTETKDVFPGMYDMCVGGLVAAGESYAECARRELAEELGVRGAPVQPVFRHHYRGADNPSWIALFEVTWGGPIVHQPEEIVCGAFRSEAAVLEQIAELPFVPDSLEIFRRYLAERGS